MNEVFVGVYYTPTKFCAVNLGSRMLSGIIKKGCLLFLVVMAISTVGMFFQYPWLKVGMPVVLKDFYDEKAFAISIVPEFAILLHFVIKFFFREQLVLRSKSKIRFQLLSVKMISLTAGLFSFIYTMQTFAIATFYVGNPHNWKNHWNLDYGNVNLFKTLIMAWLSLMIFLIACGFFFYLVLLLTSKNFIAFISTISLLYIDEAIYVFNDIVILGNLIVEPRFYCFPTSWYEFTVRLIRMGGVVMLICFLIFYIIYRKDLIISKKGGE